MTASTLYRITICEIWQDYRLRLAQNSHMAISPKSAHSQKTPDKAKIDLSAQNPADAD